MRKEELLPCPFCGESVKRVGIFGADGLEHPDNECVLRGKCLWSEPWNRRAPSPQEDALRERVGVLEKALNEISTRECEDYGGSGWNCVEFFRSTAREALTPPETTGEVKP